MITREELLVAAARADVYPAGHGLGWGVNGESEIEFINGIADTKYG